MDEFESRTPAEIDQTIRARIAHHREQIEHHDHQEGYWTGRRVGHVEALLQDGCTVAEIAVQLGTTREDIAALLELAERQSAIQKRRRR